MLARFFAETRNFVEANHDQVCETGEIKRIERLVGTNAREVAQAESFQLVVSPFFTWR